MSPTVVASAIRKSLSWLAKRGKGVSKHIGHHSRKAANVARTNPKYARRALGQSAHTVFRDPRPRKLIERALRSPDRSVLQGNGRVVVQKMFHRAIGKNGERVIHVVIDPRTGRIVTAYPVAQLLAAAPGLAITAQPGHLVSGTFDEYVSETIDGISRMAKQWAASRPERKPNLFELVLDFLLDPTPAGDPNEILYLQIHRYVEWQTDRMIHEIEKATGNPLPQSKRQTMRRQFRDAVAGATTATLEE